MRDVAAATRLGHRCLLVALAGFVLAMAAAMIRNAISGPDAEIGLIDGIFVTIGVCVTIGGVSGWGTIHGQLWMERRMIKRLGGRPLLLPTTDEERTLNRLVDDYLARIYGMGITPQAAGGRIGARMAMGDLPTDVRESTVVLAGGEVGAREAVGRAVAAVGGEALEGDRATWQEGADWIGGPVLAVFRYETLEDRTLVTARVLAKCWLTNEHMAGDGLERVIRAIDAAVAAA